MPALMILKTNFMNKLNALLELKSELILICFGYKLYENSMT